MIICKIGNFKVAIKKEGKFYVARCKKSALSGQGRTPAEAKKNIRDAIQNYCKESNIKNAICDYEGICYNKAYAEVYPGLLGGKHKGRGWSYLCRKHYFQEEKRFKNKLPACICRT